MDPCRDPDQLVLRTALAISRSRKVYKMYRLIDRIGLVDPIDKGITQIPQKTENGQA